MRQDFLNAIIAHPESDEERHKYADWLAEQGESEYAEFIRVQLELANSTETVISEIEWVDGSVSSGAVPNVRYYALRRREQELLTPYNRYIEWFDPPLVSSAWDIRSTIQYKRGLVEAIVCSWRDWWNNHKIILKASPIQEIEFTAALTESEYGQLSIAYAVHRIVGISTVEMMRSLWPSIKTFKLFAGRPEDNPYR